MLHASGKLLDMLEQQAPPEILKEPMSFASSPAEQTPSSKTREDFEKAKQWLRRTGPIVAIAAFSWYEENRAKKNGVPVQDQIKEDISSSLNWVRERMHGWVDKAADNVHAARKDTSVKESKQVKNTNSEDDSANINQPEPQPLVFSPLPNGTMGEMQPYSDPALELQAFAPPQEETNNPLPLQNDSYVQKSDGRWQRAQEKVRDWWHRSWTTDPVLMRVKRSKDRIKQKLTRQQ